VSRRLCRYQCTLYASLLDIEVTKKNEKTALQRLLLSKLDVFKKIRRIQVHLFQTFLKFNLKVEIEAQILYIIHTWNCFLTQEKNKKNHPCYKCYTAIIRRANYARPYAQIRTNSTRLTCCVITNEGCKSEVATMPYSNNVFSFHDKITKSQCLFGDNFLTIAVCAYSS
jgi:hypothetical protein